MRAILDEHIKNSKTMVSDEGEGSEEALEELKKALKVLLMKPDRRMPKAPLFLSLQNEIIQYESFMKVLHDLTKETIQDFKSKKGSTAYQASLLYVLENTLSYLQAISNKESGLILTTIKEAKLKTPEEVENYLLMEMERGKTASPSYLAGRILKARREALKKEQKEKAKAAKKLQSKKKEQEVKRDTSSVKHQKKPEEDKKIEMAKPKKPDENKEVIPIKL